jgi:hypothetical protein
MVLGAYGASLSPEINYLAIADPISMCRVLAATISHTAVRKIVVYQMFKPSSSKFRNVLASGASPDNYASGMRIMVTAG